MTRAGGGGGGWPLSSLVEGSGERREINETKLGLIFQKFFLNF